MGISDENKILMKNCTLLKVVEQKKLITYFRMKVWGSEDGTNF